MAEYKRQHYIPKFYLDNFSNNNLIWVFDRLKKEYREQSIEDTAVIKDYYTLIEDGKRDVKIEKFLGTVESETKPIINNLINCEKITDVQKVSLSIFLALLFSRTPKFEEKTNELVDKVVKFIYNNNFNSVNATKTHIENINKGKKKPIEISPEEFYDFIQNEDYKVKYNREDMISMMIHYSLEFSYHFHKKEWVVLKSLNDFEFITSDNPIVMIPTGDQINNKSSYGIDTKGVKKVLTIDNKNVLIVYDDGLRFAFGEINKEMVEVINYYIAANSNRFIFAKNKELLESVVEKTKIDKYMKTKRVELENSFKQNNSKNTIK